VNSQRIEKGEYFGGMEIETLKVSLESRKRMRGWPK